MGDVKRVIAAAALIIVIVVAGVFIAKRMIGARRPPEWARQLTVERIDNKTLETVTLTLGEWERLGYNEAGLYKNPNTGKYTMTIPMVCPSCHAKIPSFPRFTAGKRASEEEVQAREAAIREFKCPKCGANPY